MRSADHNRRACTHHAAEPNQIRVRSSGSITHSYSKFLGGDGIELVIMCNASSYCGLLRQTQHTAGVNRTPIALPISVPGYNFTM